MTDPKVLCPRDGCDNLVHDPAAMVVCTGDFYTLAGMCRGKKRLGEPSAVAIQDLGRGRAYECRLCRMWHNGGKTDSRMDIVAVVRGTIRALKADDRVGWRGLLQLADAWRPVPGVCDRPRWHEGLDQRAAFWVPW